MITKREKLQYIYVFLTDLVVLLLSTLLAWLVTDGLLKQLVPYAPSDWVQTICLLMLAFVATFICFDQTENIVTRTSGEEIKLSIKFNVLLALVYSTAMLLTKAEMLDSRYFTLAVPLINFVLLPIAHGLLKRSLLQIQSQSGLESLVGLISTQDRAELLINELQRDWSKRISGVAILEAPASEIGSTLAGVPVTANYDNFMDWIRQAALDEIYVDIPMDSGESFIPVLEEMESMGLTVHFRLLLLDRIAAPVALVVCVTLIFTVLLSQLIGVLLPVIAEKFKIDPAVMASPLITTIVDTTTLLIYFNVAKMVLHI